MRTLTRSKTISAKAGIGSLIPSRLKMSNYFLLLNGLLLAAAASAGETPQAKCTGATFKDPNIPGIQILSIAAEEKRNYTADKVFLGYSPASGLNFCEVKLYLTHPGTDDKVLVRTLLPLSKEDWNGRFLGT